MRVDCEKLCAAHIADGKRWYLLRLVSSSSYNSVAPAHAINRLSIANTVLFYFSVMSFFSPVASSHTLCNFIASCFRRARATTFAASRWWRWNRSMLKRESRTRKLLFRFFSVLLLLLLLLHRGNIKCVVWFDRNELHERRRKSSNANYKRDGSSGLFVGFRITISRMCVQLSHMNLIKIMLHVCRRVSVARACRISHSCSCVCMWCHW